jgi:hypothetical protein
MVRLLVFIGTATGDEHFLRFIKIKTKFSGFLSFSQKNTILSHSIQFLKLIYLLKLEPAKVVPARQATYCGPVSN